MGIRSRQRLVRPKAIFLDRDGVIIRQVELLTQISKVKILSKVAEAIKTFNKLGFLVIIHSNQPVIARGIVTEKGIERMNEFIRKKLEKKGAHIDAFYICPHHPNATLKKYRMRCRCRKPGAGMLFRGLKDFKIDPKKSFVIGDSIIDVVAGHRAKIRTILVKSGPGHARLDKMYSEKPNYISKNLFDSVKIIKKYGQ